MKRHIYLKKKTLEEARQIISSEVADLIRLAPETVPVEDGLGRVTASLCTQRTRPSLSLRGDGRHRRRRRKNVRATEESPRALLIDKEASSSIREIPFLREWTRSS